MCRFMAKRILVVPDVHGRLFWKEPVERYVEVADRIVFLGDYLDPYRDEDGLADDIYENLMEIVELKRRHRDKVVLLKGNHDQHYYSRLFNELAGGTRQDVWNWERYHSVFADNRDLFKIVHAEDVGGRTYVFSHAGLTLYWLKKVNDTIWRLPDNDVFVGDADIIERINLLDDDGLGAGYAGRDRTLALVDGREERRRAVGRHRGACHRSGAQGLRPEPCVSGLWAYPAQGWLRQV